MTSLVVVDDDPDIVGLYRRMLDGTEFHIVDVAHDGVAGVSSCQTHDPDILLLDLSMPEADGLEVLVQLRRSTRAKIVIVSGFKSHLLGPIAKKLGAHDYVQKGTPPQELVEALRRAATAGPPGQLALSDEEVADFLRRARQLI